LAFQFLFLYFLGKRAFPPSPGSLSPCKILRECLFTTQLMIRPHWTKHPQNLFPQVLPPSRQYNLAFLWSRAPFLPCQAQNTPHWVMLLFNPSCRPSI
jgi:hypothetical protein